MTYTTTLLLLLGIAGMLLHSLVEIGKLNKAANGNFKLFPYLKLEWPSLLISFIVICVAAALKDEVKQLQAVSQYLGLGFLAIGYMAQSVLIAIMGKAQKIVGTDSND